MQQLPRVYQTKKPQQAVIKSLDTNEATMDTLIACIKFNQTTGMYTSEETNQIMEIDTYVIPFLPKLDPSVHGTKMMIFPDWEATICLGWLKYQMNMELTMNNLILSRKVVRVVGGFTLVCQGWLPIKFVIQGRTTKQALYIWNRNKHKSYQGLALRAFCQSSI